jgi:hypothetical protein
MIVMEKGKLASVALKSITRYHAENKMVSETKGSMYPRHCEGDIEVNNVGFFHTTHLKWVVLILSCSGILFLPLCTGSVCSQTIDILLPRWRNNLRYWKERLWKKHVEPVADALLSSHVG